MKGLSWLPSVIVPTVLIVGATGGSLLAFDNANVARSDVRQQEAQQRASAPLVALTDLAALVTHGRVASWNNLNEHPDPLLDPLRLEEEIGRLDTSLKASGLTSLSTEELHAQIVHIASTDTKERHGGFHELTMAINALAGRLGGDGMADVTKAAERLAVIDEIGDAHDFLLIYRTGAGVDPYPANESLRQYLEGIFASMGAREQKQLTLADWIGATKSEASPADDRMRKATELPALAPLATDLAWALSRGGVIEHPSAEAVRDATHAGVDAVATVVRDELTAAKSRGGDRLHSARRKLTLLSVLGIVLVAFGLASFLWLLRRLHGVLSRLRSESERDQLTSLLNRTGLRAVTEPWFADRGAAPIGLAVVDLDYFKAVNDTYGHAVGDELLTQIAQRLSNEVIASRTAIARWGGDEFVLVYRFEPGNTVDNLASSAQRIRIALTAPVELADAIASVGASVGGCVCSCGNCDLEDLFREADRRLYDVKRDGRGDVRVSACGDAGTDQGSIPAPVETVSGQPWRR
jgi:diguanylate cyclase (GGDEF)-like protein